MFIKLDLKSIESTIWNFAKKDDFEIPEGIDKEWFVEFIQSEPQQIYDGLFLCDTLNFDNLYLDDSWCDYFLEDELAEACGNDDSLRIEMLLSIPTTYGVCDSIEQFCESESYKFFQNSSSEYVASFCPVTKECTGWRWEKWGEYIGNQVRTADYISDEKYIEKVFVFSIHKKVK